MDDVSTRLVTDDGLAATIVQGIVSSVAPDDTLSGPQETLLAAVCTALLGIPVTPETVDPIEPEVLAQALAGESERLRHRVVHLMVLGELILRPIPPEVARRVARYATALGIDDAYVRVARRYAQGAFGLAWIDLRQSGFAEHWEAARNEHLKTSAVLPDQLSGGVVDPELAARWEAFEHCATGTLGRGVWEMYTGRGFPLPGSPGGASAYLAQHDFVHVIADYGTNLFGELEVFSLIGWADPSPKGFAWITTLIGLFETGYVADAGFFTSDLQQRHLDSPGMHDRIADALCRGQVVGERMGCDLLDLDFHQWVERPVDDVRTIVGLPAKSDAAIAAGSPGAFDLDGMSKMQQAFVAAGGEAT